MMRTGDRGEQMKDVSVSGWNSFRIICFLASSVVYDRMWWCCYFQRYGGVGGVVELKAFLGIVIRQI